MDNREIVIGEDFDGVFRFSNWTEEDFTVLWNNKEYTFKANTRTPMIILGESPENVQEIRKRFAFKLAEREWFKSADYQRMAAMENYRGGRDDKVLEPLIQKALEPLPTARPIIREGKPEIIKTKATKAVGENDNLNEVFKDETKEENLKKVGPQPDRPTP